MPQASQRCCRRKRIKKADYPRACKRTLFLFHVAPETPCPHHPRRTPPPACCFPHEQELRNPSLVKVHSAHPHRIATYDERGLQTMGGAVVLILSEFCPGGSLQEHISRTSAARRTGGGSGAKRERSKVGSRTRGEGIIRSATTKENTHEGQSILKAEQHTPKREDTTLASNAVRTATEKDSNKAFSDLNGKASSSAEPLSRRLEIWVRQVRLLNTLSVRCRTY